MTSVFIISKTYINTSAVERIEEKLKSLSIIQILNLSLLFLLNDFSCITVTLYMYYRFSLHSESANGSSRGNDSIKSSCWDP